MLDNALIWQLDYPNGTRSFLFGTMHVRDKAAYSFVERVDQLIEEVDAYYAEMHLEEAMRHIRLEDYLMPDGMTLQNLMSERHYVRAVRHCRQVLGFDLNAHKSFYPILVANRIAESVMTEDHDLALDAYLWQLASQKGKTMGGIEAVAFQVQLLKRLEIEEQLKILKDTLRNLSKSSQGIGELKRLYEEQKILSLYKKSLNGIGRFKHEMLFERNDMMASFITSHSEESAFYAIGAAHLAGFHGVLRKVRKAGVSVKGLNFK